MKNKQKKYISIRGFILFMILALILGLSGGYGLSLLVRKNNKVSDDKVFNEIYTTINDSFYDTTQKKESLITRMAKGMVDGLGDIHTSYLSAAEEKDFDKSVNGQYEGVGMAYVKIHSGILLTKIYKGSPSAKAGLQPGDIVTAADSIALADKSIDKIEDIILGKTDTSVTLKVKRAQRIFNVKVTRKAIETDFYAYVATQNNITFGYIKLNTVGSTTAKKVERVLKAFEEHHVTELIIDLRDNGGGYVTTAQDILALFNKKGETLYYLRDKNKKDKAQKDQTDTCYSYKKGYVLVNANTASAAELIAATLKEKDGFTILGEKTYGKSIIQVERELSNGDTLKYTDSIWITSNKKIINKKGLTPDIKIKDYDQDIDTTYFKTHYQVDQVSDHIKTMEIMLQAMGYDPKRTDGYFSNDALAALHQFRQANGITNDNEYDYDDFEALLSRYAYYVNDEKNDRMLLEALKRL